MRNQEQTSVREHMQIYTYTALSKRDMWLCYSTVHTEVCTVLHTPEYARILLSTQTFIVSEF